jgi:hypothetical protein
MKIRRYLIAVSLLLVGCASRPDPMIAQLQTMLQEKQQAEVECNQQVGALAQFFIKNGSEIRKDQNEYQCVHDNFAIPYTGVCQTDGISRDCVLALDQGGGCVPDAPLIPACNEVVRMTQQFRSMFATTQQMEQTQAMQEQAAAARSQARAAWIQNFQSQQQQFVPSFTHCNSFGNNVNCTSQ